MNRPTAPGMAPATPSTKKSVGMLTLSDAQPVTAEDRDIMPKTETFRREKARPRRGPTSVVESTPSGE